MPSRQQADFETCRDSRTVRVLCARCFVSRLDVAAGWRLLSCQGTREGRAEEEFTHTARREGLRTPKLTIRSRHPWSRHLYIT